MKLAEFQRRMAADVTRTRSGKRAKVAAEYVTPNERLSAEERLDIYHRQYWFRVLDSLTDDFPALRVLLGAREFGRMSEAYLGDCPSRSFTLRNLGARLPGWMADRYPEAAVDLARLEWAHVGAFDGGTIAVLGSDDLLGDAAGLRLALQPHVQLLKLSHAADEFRLAVGRSPRRATRLRTRYPADTREILLAVHRWEGNVHYRRLEPGEWRLLRRIGKGGTLAEVLQRPPKGAKIEEWFAAWTGLGWLGKRSV